MGNRDTSKESCSKRSAEFTRVTETKRGETKEEWGENGFPVCSQSEYWKRKRDPEQVSSTTREAMEPSGKVSMALLPRKRVSQKKQRIQSERQSTRKARDAGKCRTRFVERLLLDQTADSRKPAEHDGRKLIPVGEEIAVEDPVLEPRSNPSSPSQACDEERAQTDVENDGLGKGVSQESEDAGPVRPACDHNEMRRSAESMGNLHASLAVAQEDETDANCGLVREDGVDAEAGKQNLTTDHTGENKGAVIGELLPNKDCVIPPLCRIHIGTLRVCTTTDPPLNLQVSQQHSSQSVQVPLSRCWLLCCSLLGADHVPAGTFAPCFVGGSLLENNPACFSGCLFLLYLVWSVGFAFASSGCLLHCSYSMCSACQFYNSVGQHL